MHSPTPALGPRSHTFAPCGVLAQPVANEPKVALGPTGANVAYRPASPQVVGTPKNFVGGLARGNRPPLRESLFCLSGFSVTPKPKIEAT